MLKRSSKEIEGDKVSENIAEAFVDVAGRLGKRTAIIEAATGATVSFAEMNCRADDFAFYLKDRGVKAGSIVMLMVRPSIDFICLSLALFKIGATIVLIDPGMGYRNLLKCIAGVQPEILIGIPQAIIFSKLFPRTFSSIRARICCGKSFGILGDNIQNATGISSDIFPVYCPQPEDLAAIIFTTGSTGPPKGVRYEHAIFNSQLRLIREYYRIDSNDIDQPGFPLFGLFAAALGASTVIPDMDPTRPAQVDPVKFINSINTYGVTYSFGSPAIWNVVSRYCLEKGIKLNSLKKVLMAGAPVPAELLERMQAILQTDAEIHTPYGATESLPIVDIEAAEVVGQTSQMSCRGAGTCVGRPLPDIEIRIMRMSDGAVHALEEGMLLQPGEKGEIIVKGPVVTRAYQNNPEETECSKIPEDGSFWHRMGDIGYIDGVGRLWFCGRKAHRVETEHCSMFTIPCEAVFNQHPDVYRSALVGVIVDGRRVPVIIVEPLKKIGKGKERKLLQELAEIAKKTELTSSIERFLIHGGFPVDIRHNAKIFREKLAKWAQKKITA